MFSEQSFAYCWRLWESLFARLDLPWGPNASAVIGLVAVFFLVGLLLKAVMESES
ncbi:MAG: hypothetical protein K8S25_09250 [Alphaproteobacteria bacterium]|nr:hypothetical protein [Alphaproteobacteria bacterium]